MAEIILSLLFLMRVDVLHGAPSTERPCFAWRASDGVRVTFPDNSYGIRSIRLTGEAYNANGNGLYDLAINDAKTVRAVYLTPKTAKPTFNVLAQNRQVLIVPQSRQDCFSWSGSIILIISAPRGRR